MISFFQGGAQGKQNIWQVQWKVLSVTTYFGAIGVGMDGLMDNIDESSLDRHFASSLAVAVSDISIFFSSNVNFKNLKRKFQKRPLIWISEGRITSIWITQNIEN